ncbi:MAG: hypothetical protein M3N04_05925 [Actinomycetota bacterium]|nr:hypothetical protein [Actinomycetota bacterium]
MKPGDDLAAESLAAVAGDRPLQSHRVLLSAAVTASDWARAGAPHGAVVVADQQIAPRGRAGRPWKVAPGQGLAFALVLRPQLASEREGWLYTVVLTALADACGDGVTIEWPDEIHREGVMAAATGIEVRLGGLQVKWAVVNLLVPAAQPPRGELLGSVLQAIDARLASPPRDVLEDYSALCRTLGRDVRMRLLGGAARLQGRALEVLDDGALVLESDSGRRIPVRPQDIGSIEDV